MSLSSNVFWRGSHKEELRDKFPSCRTTEMSVARPTRGVQKRRGIAADNDEDAAELRFGAEFEETDDCKALMISEVKVLLELVEDKKRREGLNSSGSDIKQKTLDYCQRFSRFPKAETIKELRQLFPPDQFQPFETAQLANLCCETVEEAKSLIPSLNKRFDSLEDGKLLDLLDQMSNLRKF
ncbi:HRDC-like protein [Zopfochytrium polystomum]|nr:HRDC-like protein [Zopfochytrium polystomum]